MLGRTRLALAAATLAASLTLTAGLAGAAGWVAPVPLNVSAASGAEAPAVGIDGTGNTIVSWQTSPAVGPHVIQGARHAFGGVGFQQLPDIASDAALSNADAIVVVNRAGHGLVAWVHDTNVPATQQVQMSPISPGGIIGAEQDISPTGGNYSQLAGAINENGDAVIAWSHTMNVEAVTRSGINGTFTAPQTLDTAGAGAASVAIDSGGNAMVLWPTTSAPPGLAYRSHPAGGPWPGSNGSISTAGHTYTQQTLAANPTGQAVVAFLDTNGVNSVVDAVGGTVSGGFGLAPSIQTLSGVGVQHGPGVNVDDTGGAVVGWATGTAVQFSSRPAGFAFPPPAGAQSITSAPVMPANFELAGNGRGDVVASWYQFILGPNHNIASAAVKPAGSNSFGASQVISDRTRDTYDERIALDQNGDAVVGLPLGSSGGPLGVEAAVYDASPPLLGSVTGPTRLARGTRGSFSASAIDAFSDVRFSWSFGDGSASATAASVSHTYTRTGRFTVKVTATDAAGNQAAKQISVTVTPPPPPPPCIVPRLKGKTLSQAKTLLRRAHCKLGRVHKPKPRRHHKLGKLVVSSQSPSARKRRINGTKVALTLGPAPKPKPKHEHKH